jgi:sarcosine oxidase
VSTYQTIVLGLGAVGSAAICHLARLGNAVLGLDRHTPPHIYGSTHGDTRITRLAIGEGPEYTPLALRSHELWRGIERETGATLLTSCGGLIISNPTQKSVSHGVANFFENTLAAARMHGIAHEVLDAAAMGRRFPQFQVASHEVAYYEPEAGFLMVEDCVRANLALARQHGAAIATDEKVEAFHASAQGVTITTTKGTYRGDRLLITAGSWLPKLVGDPLQGLFRVTRQVLHWFEISGDHSRFAPGTCPVFIWELPGRQQGIYGFPAVGSAGSVKIATEQTARVSDPDTVERAVSAAEMDEMHAHYVRPYLPDLGPRSARTAVCLYTEAPGGRFVVDTLPDHPRVSFASACSGHGFKHSAALGEALAQRLVGGDSAVDLRPFAIRELLRQVDKMNDAQKRNLTRAMDGLPSA